VKALYLGHLASRAATQLALLVCALQRHALRKLRAPLGPVLDCFNPTTWSTFAMLGEYANHPIKRCMPCSRRRWMANWRQPLLMFRILPNAETEAEARAQVVESCTLIARDPALADDLLDVAERWNTIVRAS
jgi:hypothetical protein